MARRSGIETVSQSAAVLPILCCETICAVMASRAKIPTGSRAFDESFDYTYCLTKISTFRQDSTKYLDRFCYYRAVTIKDLSGLSE